MWRERKVTSYLIVQILFSIQSASSSLFFRTRRDSKISFVKNQNLITKSKLQLLSVRGGSNNYSDDTTIASSTSSSTFTALTNNTPETIIFPTHLLKKSELSFVQNLSGHIFSLGNIIFGLACLVHPVGCASFFYGAPRIRKGEKDKIETRVKLIGSIAMGIGITSSFAITSDLRLFPKFANVVPDDLFYQAIGIGLFPRIFYLFQILFEKISVFRDSMMIWIYLVESLLFFGSIVHFSTDSNMVTPHFPILLEALLSFSIAPVLFFKPELLLQQKKPWEKDENSLISSSSIHEKWLVRINALYFFMNAILVSLLVNKNFTSIGAISSTALVWVLANFYLTFVQKTDFKECGCFFTGHIIMMIFGFGVAVGGMHSYFY